MTIKHRTRIGAIFGPVINWSQGLDFEVQYRTVVQQYGDGIEERESIRVFPRFRMSFTGHFMDADAEDFVAEFSRNYDSIWYFPLPFRKAEVSYVLNGIGVLDQTKLKFANGIPFWVIAGASLIVQTDSVRELVTVASIDNATTVTLTTAMTTPISEAIAFSAMPIQFESDTAMTLLTTNLYQFKAAIMSVVGDETFPFKSYTPNTTLSSAPVYTRKPNWRDGVDDTLNPALRQVDFGFGRRYQKMIYDFVSRTTKSTFMFQSNDDMESILSFIHYLKGRRKPFWYPTWSSLIDRVPGAPASNVRFYTSNAYLGRNYSGSKTHRNLLVRFNDGTIAARQITEFNVVSSPNYLGFSALPQNITDTSLYEASWLTLNRLATDEVIFQFKSSAVGEVELSMNILPTREVQ